jgi:hypothetical protein
MKLSPIVRYVVAPRRAISALLLIVALGLAAVSTARAQLTLNYDTAHDKVWFTGTDTITSEGAGKIAWWNNVTGISPFSHLFSNIIIPNILNSTVATTSEFIDMDQSGSTNHFAFTIDTASSTSVTLTGLGYGAAISFGDFNGAEVAVLNSLSGSTVPLFYGSGASALNLQAVPET